MTKALAHRAAAGSYYGGFFALVLYRQVCAQEGSLLPRLPHLAYRVLKTALRLRPRRALSSALGQKSILAPNTSNEKSEIY